MKKIIFNGRTYRSYGRYYACHRWTTGTSHKLRKVINSYLHRDVWEFYNGKIPKGYEVHHVDGNRDNNNISNLQLLSKEDHKTFHATSPRYRALNRKHSIDFWATREKQLHSCRNCNLAYYSRSLKPTYYCGSKCKYLAYKQTGFGKGESPYE